MPEIELLGRYQWALLWTVTGVDAYGQVVVSTAPIELRVKWNTKRMEVLSKDGSTIALDAQAVVDRKIAIGSHMWLGDLETWRGTGTGSGTGSGNVADELHQVKTIDETHDFRGRVTMRTVGLMRLRDVH